MVINVKTRISQRTLCVPCVGFKPLDNINWETVFKSSVDAAIFLKEYLVKYLNFRDCDGIYDTISMESYLYQVM